MTTTTPTAAIQTQLHIEPAEFAEGIRAFQRAWIELEEGGGSAWQDVRVVEDSYGPPLLRISRLLDTLPSPTDDAPEAPEDEDDAGENDDEALVRSLPPKSSGQKTTVIYDIVYSPSYRVPVLYITLSHPPPNSNIHDLLVPASHRAQLQHAGGSLGALSLTDHPITGLPAYFIHPCRTAEGMAAITKSGEVGGRGGPMEYLMRWLGLVGPSVGLSVPVRLAQAMSKLQL
ncbi:hypothetical protein LTR56_010407 [Elasticomyces elasticus]|nr:hypothetical protein LTR22_024391 [Elasticomyces elasticus]KAK3643033.1 hypothetical protein LTR56_010407 [Elasticomyces elasticus]KAK4916810.1 hypothetical protein LTR49_015254 [Elasticomyces elasticus]KAK5755960.1 hypothetical protein LTS12_013964 [Elasticomyces elasticus]